MKVCSRLWSRKFSELVQLGATWWQCWTTRDSLWIAPKRVRDECQKSETWETKSERSLKLYESFWQSSYALRGELWARYLLGTTHHLIKPSLTTSIQWHRDECVVTLCGRDNAICSDPQMDKMDFESKLDESGINLDFDFDYSVLEEDDTLSELLNSNFYELKSKTVPANTPTWVIYWCFCVLVSCCNSQWRSLLCGSGINRGHKNGAERNGGTGWTHFVGELREFKIIIRDYLDMSWKKFIIIHGELFAEDNNNHSNDLFGSS